jgi:hypothetical protein
MSIEIESLHQTSQKKKKKKSERWGRIDHIITTVVPYSKWRYGGLSLVGLIIS